MIITNPNIPILILEPAIACQRSKAQDESGIITYDEANAAVQSSNAFVSFLVTDATNKELIGQLALMPYGSYYDFSHTPKKITFGYEREAVAFVKLEEGEEVDFKLVKNGKFLAKDAMAEIFANASPELKALQAAIATKTPVSRLTPNKGKKIYYHD